MQTAMSTFEQTAPTARTSVSAEMTVCCYILFSLADLFFSSIALGMGIPEANPILAWFAHHNLFAPAKIGLTLATALFIKVFYSSRPVRQVAWGGVMLMASLTVYHIWGLSMRLDGIW